MSRRQASVLAVTGALALLFGGSSVSGEETGWIAFSRVMAELSHNREFVERVHKRLGRDPRAGGILGPEQIKKLRKLILGKQFEALDRFPGITVRGMGRAVRLAALALNRSETQAETVQTASTTRQGSNATQDAEEALGIPTHGVPPATDSLLKALRFRLVVGDRIDPERATRYPDSVRFAEVLNRLALNPAKGEAGTRYRVVFEGERVDRPEGLVALLSETGHEVEVRDARYFANFGDLIYKGLEVLTPFWLDTEIVVPETGRSLLVPVSHSQHEVVVRGPAVNADLSFFFGIDGEAEFRTNETKDQAWVLGRVARTYRGAEALEVVRIAGAIVKTYSTIKRNHPTLPFGGYYALGVCNDVNAMIELHMQGETSLFPLTHDPELFAGQGEVQELARRLPVDGRGNRKPDLQRILGSLPVDDLSQLPLPGLRRDLELVRAAWVRGKSAYVDSWTLLYWVVAGSCMLAVVWLLVRQRRRRGVSEGRLPSST